MVAPAELEKMSELLDDVAELYAAVERLREVILAAIAINSGNFKDAKNCGNFENHDVHIWQDGDDQTYACDGGW